MGDLRLVLLLFAITGCATAPAEPPAPAPVGTSSWDLAPSVAPERFELRLPGVGRITFSPLEPVTPIGVERGESFAGVESDLLGIGFGDEEPVRSAPRPRPIDPDLSRVEERRRRDALDRSIGRVLDAAERARERPAGPTP